MDAHLWNEEKMSDQSLNLVDPVASIYKHIGSNEPYFALVEEFYKGVQQDFLLRPMYPEDLEEPKRKLALFLIQRTGGETTYSDERGHPRMRARHMPFKIGMAERDAWMRIMTRALDAVPQFHPHRESLLEFFDGFSLFMINQHQ